MNDKQPQVIFNSNKIRHDSVIEHEYSPNGKYCALTIGDKNQISIEVMIVDVETAEVHGKCLQLYSFEKIAWSGDSKGFFIYVNICVFLSIFTLRLTFSHWILLHFVQYDPNRDRNRNLYYHYLDDQKPDKFIAKIPKAEADEISFKISNDHRYLILCDSQALYAANVESLEQEIQFKVIFKITENVTYVSRKKTICSSSTTCFDLVYFLCFRQVGNEEEIITMTNLI